MVFRLLGLALLLLNVSPAHAEVFRGVDFPDGARSFADVVADFSPAVVSGQPSSPYLVSDNAAGIPDYNGANTCGSTCSFVSLGDGGSITLRFTDNVLTGSGDSGLDLWIFEVGPDVEDTFVDVSTNGVDWIPVGKVFGSTAGIDLDAYGFGPEAAFTWVRLTDDPNEGANTGSTVGADIDAVGAISSDAGCDIASVNPEFPWSTGDSIEIIGDGFVEGSVPRINGVVAAPYVVNGVNSITATVPSLANGSYTLSVDLTGGRSCTYATGVVHVRHASWSSVKARFD